MKAVDRKSRRLSHTRRHLRQAIEQLEDRTLLSSYLVTTLGDGVGSVTPAGVDKYNATTLRAAITAANAHTGADSISFSSLLLGTINLGSALPKIASPLTVTGPGSSKLTLKRNAASAFSILYVNPGVVTSVSGLTLTNGAGTRQADGSVFGGGVYNAGSLTLGNCVISSNNASGARGLNGTNAMSPTSGKVGRGGGIYSTGSLTLTGSTVTGNKAVGGTGGERYSDRMAGSGGNAAGGGIFAASGSVSVTGGSVTANAAYGGIGGYGFVDDGTGGFAEGGGIYTWSGVTTKLTGTAVTYNNAVGGIGGAVFASNGPAVGGGLSVRGITTITSTTISGNSANAMPNAQVRSPGYAYGGGLFNDGTLGMSGGTISNNRVSGGTAEGGGIYHNGWAKMTLDLLTVSGNTCTGSLGRTSAGGGLQNLGTATISRSTFSSNRVVGGEGNSEGSASGGDAFGGGIGTAEISTLVLTSCTLSGNSATGGRGMQEYRDLGAGIVGKGGDAYGGGLSSAGKATVTSCAFSGNTAKGGQGGDSDSYVDDSGGFGGIASGGAIAASYPLTLVGSTLSGNNAIGGAGGKDIDPTADVQTGGPGGEARGGGLFTTGYAIVKNATVYGNTATGGSGASARNVGGAGGNGSGGGIYLLSGSLISTNVTVTANRSYGAYGGSGPKAGKNGSPVGGGVRIQAGAATLYNSIIAGNFNGSTAAGDISGAVQSVSAYNVVGTGGAGGMINGQKGNKTNVAPTSLKLGTLASNGGPTKTVALLLGSVAINAGSNTFATNAGLTKDQRGFARIAKGIVDAGAFEAQ